MAKGLDAGNAYVTVHVDTSKFTGELNRNVKKGLSGVEQDSRKSMGKVTAFAAGMAKTGALAIAGGTVAAASGILKVGMAYQDSMNSFQAVTRATGAQMAQVGKRAKALGNDLTLPGTSAGGAAAAMTELAKSGLSVDEAMAAAKGTLQLATAAQIDGARAAEIQGNALAMFGLKGSEAGHVADVLANAANAASGEISDFADALKYVGPIARSAGISLDQTATAMGVLANAGIKGEQAGTTLREMLRSLAAPSAAGAKALKALGINAYDSNHKFVGFGKVIGQLTAAQKRMSQEGFSKATSDAFGASMAGVIALAQQGPAAFGEMEKAISKQGGAAEVAAAKSKGLSGAWDGLMSTLESIGTELYEKVGPGIENVLRGISEKLPGVMDDLGDFGEKVASVFEEAGKTFDDLGGNKALKSISDSLKTITDTVGTKLTELWDKFEPTITKMKNDLLPTIKSIFKDVSDNIENVAKSKAWTGIFDALERIGKVLEGPVASAWKAAQPLFKAFGSQAFVGAGIALAGLAGGLQTLALNLEMVEWWIKLFWNALKTAIGWVTGTAVPAVRDFVTSVSSFLGVSSVIESVVGYFRWLWTQAVTIFGAIRARVVSAFITMWNSAVTAVSGGVRRVLTFVAGLRTSVLSVFSKAATWLVNAGRDIVGGIVSGIWAVRTRVATTLGSVKSAVLNVFIGAGSWLYNAGKNIIDGIERGIRAAFGAVRSAVEDLKRLIPDWATRFFKAASPARIMLGPGRSIGEGLAAGITASTGLVEQAVDRLAAAARTSISPVVLPVVAEPTLAAGRIRGTGPIAGLQQAAASHQAAPAVQVTVNGALDPNAVGRQVVDLLKRENRFRVAPVIAR